MSRSRHLLVLAFFLLSISFVKTQNIQLHYDFGRFLYEDDLAGRSLFTSTVEMFKVDKWGSTFFFIDMDYKSSGVASAYWEIARELKFWQNPFSIHLEYNGGLNYIRNAYMLGATYTYNNPDFRMGYSLTAMYKNLQKQDYDMPHNFQLTGTWYLHFAKDRLCTFTGFLDFWKEKTLYGDYVFLSEPQFWLHLNKLDGIDDNFNLSIGSEVELGYNFAARDGFFAIPTAAIKWDF
jgi:hypothetical protein